MSGIVGGEKTIDAQRREEKETYQSKRRRTVEMAHADSSRRSDRKSLSSLTNKSIPPSLIVRIDQTGIVNAEQDDCCTYRTESYLHERERQCLPMGRKTTWKNLMQEKQILDTDQAEINRVLATIDSIHGTFNRSLIKAHQQVYSSLYGEDELSNHLMKTFCQRQDHFNKEQKKTSIRKIFHLHQDYDSISSEDDDDEEKKRSYDSGYGETGQRRHSFREFPNELSVTLKHRTNSLL